MAHDLSDLLELYGGKTCFIGCNLSFYACDRYIIVCFANETSKLAAIGFTLMFKSVNLCWTGLSLACCANCKQFGHVFDMCSAGENSGVYHKRIVFFQNQVCLANIYKKKQTPVAHSVSFGKKTWAQIADGSPFYMALSVPFGVDSLLGAKLLVIVSNSLNDSDLADHMTSLECSVELLLDQISEILRKLSFVELVLLLSPFSLDLDMVVDNVVMSPFSSPPVTGNAGSELSLSSLKILTTKVSGLELKMMALEVSISFGIDKFGFVSSSSFSMNDFVWRVATCNIRGINNPAKQKDIICWHKDMNNLIFIIINKFSSVWVFTSELDSGHMGSGVAIIMNIFLVQHVCKVSEMPGQLLSIKLLFKNKLSVLILGLYIGASSVVRFSQTGKINSFIAKTVNKVFFVVLGRDFNEDSVHKCASFKRCLDLGLVNSLLGSPVVKVFTWENLRGVKKTIDYILVSSNLVNIVLKHSVVDMFSDKFTTAVKFSDLDAMWDVLCRIMTFLANEIFRKKWFKNFDSVFTKVSSKFHKLELLDLIDSGGASNRVHFALSNIRKSYYVSKLAESLAAKEANIKAAIDKRMESFKTNKSHTIRSVLEHSFCKGVLDHLVVDNKLILESNSVKSKVDIIIEDWTKKCGVVANVSDVWFRQYQLLNYVFDKAFSGIMCSVKLSKLLNVIFNLPNSKAAGLSGITNKLWKPCDKSILDMLLMLLNFCLSCKSSVFMNIHPIALIKTAHKIFSKILSDKISLACSTFNVLHEDNFSVLKSTITQFPIFAVGSVVEDALENNQELWLVLQNMQKAYNSFIWFFGSIHKNCTNRVMTDFELINGYCVHDGLDQGEVFFPLLWHIFYDPLLCEAGLFSFFVAGVFIDDTIWVGSMVISINSRVSNPSLSISGSPISIAKKGESHQYLGIFLSTEGLSKPSLVKTNSNVCFFTNLVLKKIVSDKQFLYLVSAVLYSIVNYKMQFNIIPIDICNKWDALIYKGLKLKSDLLLDFSSDTIYHTFFYGLKSFFQVAFLVSFVNSDDILGYLFSHRSHDLQVLCWYFVHPLSFPVCICVSVSNNFLVGIVCVLLNCNLSLGGFLTNLFWFCGGIPMFTYSIVFVNQLYDHCGSVFDWHTFKHWKRLDPHGPVFEWFKLFVFFLLTLCLLNGVNSLNILESHDFVSVCDCLLQVGANSLLVYTDRSLSGLSTAGCRTGVAIFFEDIDLGLGIGVSGLMSSTLVKLQAIVLSLKCVPLMSSVKLFSNSQSALDVCRSELDLACPNFHNQCWVECCHIVNVIYNKNPKIRNECTDAIASNASLSSWHFLLHLGECFIMANGSVVSDNSRQFVYNIYYLVCYVCWEIGFGFRFLADSLLSELPVAVWKHLYNRLYPSVLCLYCNNVKTSDHMFFCKIDDSAHCQLLEFHVNSWKAVSGLFHSSSDAVTIFQDPKIACLEIVKF
ncbi:hypothetical protein G9A89_001659, partial [Geosiphon pyriformis]